MAKTIFLIELRFKGNEEWEQIPVRGTNEYCKGYAEGVKATLPEIMRSQVEFRLQPIWAHREVVEEQ